MRHFMDFQEKVCVITGAGSKEGIGFAATKLLGQLGGSMALISTSNRIFQREEELKTVGIRAKGYIADLTDRLEVERVMEKIVKDFGGIHVLVNNAGLAQVDEDEPAGEFTELSYDGWDKVIGRNLTLCANVMRNVIPHMRRNQYGRIVNVASVTGPMVSTIGSSAYGAGKSAVIGMSKAIALEVAKDHIVINNVLPGWIKTASQSERGAIGGSHTPMGRSGEPEEVANMIAFLASEEASYITGGDFVVDGGNVIQEMK